MTQTNQQSLPAVQGASFSNCCQGFEEQFIVTKIEPVPGSSLFISATWGVNVFERG